MGDPKYPRRVWKKPKRPLNYELKMEELKTLGTFGLRTKRELWKAHTELSRVRHQARSLLALRQEIREEKEPILMKSLVRIGLVSSEATLDDVLNLNADDLLSRRLQSIVTKKLGFKTPYQARQAVIHGHIMIGDRKINIPSYTVKVEEEESIHFTPESKIPELLEKNKAEEPVVETATEGSTETATEGSTETATEGSTETATEGSTETATEGSTETATEGSTETNSS
ncbi:MAG: 30S ribosomal protein S4 [Nitrosopumilus sp.]|nr:MAG: 30S ribosomal protein S4 [Nitrosopumilus sp.]